MDAAVAVGDTVVGVAVGVAVDVAGVVRGTAVGVEVGVGVDAGVAVGDTAVGVAVGLGEGVEAVGDDVAAGVAGGVAVAVGLGSPPQLAASRKTNMASVRQAPTLTAALPPGRPVMSQEHIRSEHVNGRYSGADHPRCSSAMESGEA